MITNERQYRITSAQLEKLRAAVDAFSIKAPNTRPKTSVLVKAELAALHSEYENLSRQIQEYETLKSGAVEILKASTLAELPRILIRARIAKGFSQRQLAEAIGLKEQQIQRYEAEEYSSACLRRLADVATALGLNITEVAELRATSQPLRSLESADLAWDQFPIREMYRRNWFEGFSGSLSAAVAHAEELVKNFVQRSLNAPVQAATRQRVRSDGVVDWYALLAWQCRAIALARKSKPENRYKPNTITHEWLVKLSHVSCQVDGPRKAVDYLLDSGIPLVIEPHLSHTHLDGAALLLPEGTPMVGMTLRQDRLDNFWFVLIHELIHVMKHLHKGDAESIFDDLDADADEIEQETDSLAGEILVPENRWNEALARYVRNQDTIEDFASELTIHPAIVAGKIRREADNYTILQDMVGQGEVRKLFPEVHFA